MIPGLGRFQQAAEQLSHKSHESQFLKPLAPWSPYPKTREATAARSPQTKP